MLFIALLPLIITFIKRRRQVGKTWCKPVHATVLIKDKQLQCTHCGQDKFSKREGLLATSIVSFFRMSFWNYSAPCYICQNCGCVHWFVSPEEKADIHIDA